MKNVPALAALFTMLAFSVSPLSTFAEGSKQLMNDISSRAALSTVNATFATYNSASNADTRLNIHISDPATEIVYLGFSLGYSSGTSDILGEGSADRYFRILDPNGNIVFGPQKIDATNAIPTGTDGFNKVVAGPSAIAGSTGYTAFVFNPSSITGAIAGDYFIEFNKGTATSSSQCSFDYWDITVADNSGTSPIAIDGRVWAKQWGFYSKDYTSGGYSGVFKGKLYSYTDEGFVDKVDFSNSDFRGGSFIIGMNSTGPGNSEDIIADRRSLYAQRITAVGYKLFLNNPDETVYPSGDASVASLQISAPTISCKQSTIPFKFNLSEPGLVEILLDFNGDGIFNPNSKDLLLAANAQKDDNTINWDRKDGLGGLVSDADLNTIKVEVKYEQAVHHLSLVDIEYLSNGFTVESVRPTAGSVSKFYWDDSNIASAAAGNKVPYATGPQPNAVELQGSAVRKWDNFTDNNTVGFGNSNTINTWWNNFQIEKSFNLFSPGCSSVLPVKINSFTAIKKENTVHIQWQTSQEENMNYFGVERSIDGVSFIEIVKVEAEGKHNKTPNYIYDDPLVEKNVPLFYRIRSVDKNGSSELSPVRRIDISSNNSNENILTVYPNPVINQLNIVIPATWAGKKVQYEVINDAGKTVIRKESAGEDQTETLNSSSLLPGLYILSVSCNGEKLTKQFIKK